MVIDASQGLAPGRVSDRIGAIRVRVRTADDAVVAAHARDDLRELSEALGGVLDLHRPGAGARWCLECSRGRRHCRWPCPTRRAIARALGVEERS